MLERLFSGKEKKKVMYGVAAAIVVFITSVIIISNTADSPKSVVKDFMQYAKDDNFNNAKGLWAKQGQQDMVNTLSGDERWIYQNFRNLAHRWGSNIVDFEIVNEETHGDKAGVRVRITYDNGKVTDTAFAVMKEKGDWKIYGF